MSAASLMSAAVPISSSSAAGCRLWIDGVGCWLIWFAEELILGNGSPGASAGRLRILADLRTRHAALRRSQGGHQLTPGGAVLVNGEQAVGEVGLASGDLLRLGEDVLVRYLLPSPLSGSTVLTIESGHRTVERADGIVLFEQTCLLGPGEQNHIRCRHWPATLVLFVRERQLWMRTHGQPATVAKAASLRNFQTTFGIGQREVQASDNPGWANPNVADAGSVGHGNDRRGHTAPEPVLDGTLAGGAEWRVRFERIPHFSE